MNSMHTLIHFSEHIFWNRAWCKLTWKQKLAFCCAEADKQDGSYSLVPFTWSHISRLHNVLSGMLLVSTLIGCILASYNNA